MSGRGTGGVGCGNVVLLLSIDGLTVQEIADQLNISINTVKTQKKRAYVFLKENLKQSLLLIYILEILK